jgi:hypothetical protein
MIVEMQFGIKENTEVHNAAGAYNGSTTTLIVMTENLFFLPKTLHAS